MTTGHSRILAPPPRRILLWLGLFDALLAASVLAGWVLDIGPLKSAFSLGAAMLSLFVGLTALVLGLFFLNEDAANRAIAAAHLAAKSERLSVLHEIDLAIIAARTPAEIAKAALPRLRDLLELPRVIVNLFDLEKGEAEWLVAVGRNRIHVGEIRYSMELMGDVDGLRRGELQFIDVAKLRQRPEREALLASGVRWYWVIPLIVGNDLIGGLSFGGPSPEILPEKLEIAQEVAAQLAIALAQTRLDERAQRADAQYRLMFESVPIGIAMTTLDGSLVSLNPTLCSMLGYESSADAVTALAADTRRLYADPDARDNYLSTLRRDGVVSRFETQFRRKDGSLIWVSMSGRPMQALQGEDSKLVTMIDDVTLRKAQENRIARLSRMREMHSSINAATSRIRERQPLLDELCRIAVVKGNFRAAWVAWHDADARWLRHVASAGHLAESLELIDYSTDVPAGAAIRKSLRVLREGASIVTNDTRIAGAVRDPESALEAGYLSIMHLPLRIGDTVEGVLVLFAAEAGFFDDEERRLLDELAGDVSLALESLQKSEQLDFLAYYDPLTRLPNRSLFHEMLSHSLHARDASARLIAVVVLDLERFRLVNESHGRHAGDRLLREVGERLQRASDSAARIGPDMFALMLRGTRRAAELNRSLEAIITACFAEPFVVGAEELRVACRAGVSVHPNDGSDADLLLRNAEAALDRSHGADERVVFYAPEMNARMAEALAIENGLRRAIEAREFELHYQPKVDLANGRIVGLEALIRWRDPRVAALVQPGRFIPVLEQTGMIVEVGRWTIEQTFADQRAWAALGIRVPRVAVNVSAIQLQRKDFVETMIEEIRRAGDKPEWLELEITESILMRNVEESIRKLSILQGIGVLVSIDDFGTGYSSLSYLSRLPVDCLKIDRSFVSGLTAGGDAVSIASTIITLAHSLKLKVVAEGVETRAQAEFLRKLGCDQAQGFLYSHPIPAGDIEAVLRAGGTLPMGKGREESEAA